MSLARPAGASRPGRPTDFCYCDATTGPDFADRCTANNRAVATLRHELPPGEENGIGVITHELTFRELAVVSQYLLKLQSGKITNIPCLVTAKCRRQMSCCQTRFREPKV